MTTQVLTGLLLLVLPVAYTTCCSPCWAAASTTPPILRQPTRHILDRFAAGGSRLVLLWWAFAMSAVLLAPVVVLVSVSATLVDANPTIRTLATAIGLLAALVQFLGLIRWPFAVPHLARLATDRRRPRSPATPSRSPSRPSTATSAWPSASSSATCSPGSGPHLSASLSSNPTCCIRCSGSSGWSWRRCSCSARWSSSDRSSPAVEAGRHAGAAGLHRLVAVAAGPRDRPAGHGLTPPARSTVVIAGREGHCGRLQVAAERPLAV
jgi:hypothetical protein